MNNQTRLVVTYLVMGLLVVAAFFVGTAVVSTTAQQNTIVWPVTTQQAPVLSDNVTDEERQLSGLYNGVAPSVVSINVVARSSGVESQFNFGDELVEGTGTGFVIDSNGNIVTNAHVVQGATRIEVNFFDGTITRAEIVGIDLDSDIAVINVDLPVEQLRPVTFADSDALFIGQEVVAIGSPFNQPWTMTTGIISALNRSIRGLNQNYSIGSVIQTDAAINPGNSGGPLLNLSGQVIGVNAQILSQTRSNSGIGFAIPSNLTQRVAQSLMETGTMEYSYLGIEGTDVNLYYIEALGLPSNARGVVVTGVMRNSPAARAGIQAPDPTSLRTVDGVQVPSEMDIITAIDGTPVTSMGSLIAYLASHTAPGDTVQMTVVRNGSEQLTVPVTLAARPGSTIQ